MKHTQNLPGFCEKKIVLLPQQWEYGIVKCHDSVESVLGVVICEVENPTETC